MYWNTIGNDISQVYDKFMDDNFKKSEKFSFLNNNFSNFIKKLWSYKLVDSIFTLDRD